MRSGRGTAAPIRSSRRSVRQRCATMTRPITTTSPSPTLRCGAAGPWRPALVAYVAALVVGGVVRAWQIDERTALSWNDTVDFLALSGRGWTSAELWAGIRAPGGAAGAQAGGRRRARGTSTCRRRWPRRAGPRCCASVATVVAGRWPRVVARRRRRSRFSLTTPVTMWDRSVLSESPGVATLALVVAAGAPGRPRRHVAAGGAAARGDGALAGAAGHAMRSSPSSVGARRWPRRRRRGPRPPAPRHVDRAGRRAHTVRGATTVPRRAVRGPVGGARSEAGPAALGPAGSGPSWPSAARRCCSASWCWPARHTASGTRSRPGTCTRCGSCRTPTGSRWFADHGMPQADEFVGPDARPVYPSRACRPSCTSPTTTPSWRRGSSGSRATGAPRWPASC